MDCVMTILGVVGKPAWDFIQPHLGYLFCYNRNIDNMEKKFGELDGIRKDVERQVEDAHRERLGVVKNEVQTWLANVEKVEVEVKRIRDEVANNNSFLHFWLHYTLGSQAADKIQAIDDLLVKKGGFNGVSHSRTPPCTTGSLLVNESYAMFQSRESCLNEILDALKDETVHMIGVYGMGGIGKTTLVKEAVKQAKKDGLFTHVVMVTVSQNLDVKRIQTGIAESLCLELNEETEEVRAGKIEERLGKEGNSVLVVLDDLWEKLELSKVRIPGTCRVVITSRREDVCYQMGCKKKVELRTLSDEESWLLFKSRAGNVVESPTMKEVAKECAGLPLALVVLGTALKGKKLEVWNTVLNQLKQSTIALDLPDVNEKVRESIALSYENLGEAAKWCFLHCCLYPEDYDLKEKDLMHMLVGGGVLEDVGSLHKAQDRVHVLMDQLKASGLLLEVYGESCVRMHDVVRDVGIWIGEKDHGFFVRAGQGLEEWPRNSDVKLQNCRRLSLMSNQIVDLPSNPIKCVKLETLILSRNSELSNIPENFFQHMGALKVLDLSHTNISRLPESLSCLTNLRVLNLKRCMMLQDISPINGLKMLEILILKAATRVSVVPEDIGGLLNLRLVDLGSYESTTSLITYVSNVSRGCSRLEQLFIPMYEGCLAELASLRFLTHLYIWGDAVDSNDSLSQDMGSSRSWTKLQDFLICFLPSSCESWFYPEMKRRSLYLTRTQHFSPSLKVLFEKIESLSLRYCQESEFFSIKCDIPPHMFHNLKQLMVLDCLNLTSLGDKLLCQLIKLMSVKRCPKLAMLLPSKVSQSMHQMEKLEVKHCTAMLQLFPYDHKPLAMIELLPKLVELQLYKLPKLESVLQPFQCLPNLMTLGISKCGLRYGLSYHEMEMAADPFPKLQKLDIKICSEMSQMIFSSSPDALQGMCIFQNLSDLTVAECPRLTHLFWSKQAKHMQQLTSLEISDCDLLTAVVISNENQEEGASASSTACMVVDHHGPHSFFPLLKVLVLKGLPEITAFHQSTALSMDWPSLKKHLIEECPKLETPLLGPQMSQLKLMKVVNFPKMTWLLPSKLWQSMHQLEVLEVIRCTAILQLFPFDDKPMAMAQLLPKLGILELRELPVLESVLQPFQCLKNLTTLGIYECGLRCGLAYHEMELAAADPFPKLQILNVSRCTEMLHLFPYDHKPIAMTQLLPKLVELSLWNLPQLESVLQPFQCLPNLMELEIWGCGLRCGLVYHHEMEMAADPFPKLQRIKVTDCRAMLHLFPYDHKPMAMTELLPKLAKLNLSGLPQLESVLQPFQCLPNLMTLDISKCGLRYGLAYHEMEMAAGPFPKLQRLEVIDCTELLHLFPYDDDKPMAMTELLPELEYLKLSKLPQLESILQPFQCLPNLTSLEILDCGLSCGLAYHEMEMAANPFPKLKRLIISGWMSEKSQMFSSSSSGALQGMCIFQNLTHLDVAECPRLTHLFWSKQANLMKLRVVGCGLKYGLVYHETKMAADPFPNLKELDIRRCWKMSQMISSSSPDVLQGMCIFQNLCHLIVDECPKLTHLFWSKQAKLMQQLTELEIYDCESLTAVVISNGNQEKGASTSTSTTACMVVDHHGSHSFFPRLEELKLKGLLKMAAFHQLPLPMEWPFPEKHVIREWPKLETPLLGPQMSQLKLMKVENFPKMTRLLPSKLWQGMHQLEQLNVKCCRAMLHMFTYDDDKPMAMTELLPKLEYLKLSELPQLESVLQPFQCLPNLMTLQISKCGLKCGLVYHEMEMTAGPFPKLQKLRLVRCRVMLHLFPYDHKLMAMTELLPKLVDLYLSKLPQLDSVLQPFQCLPNLMKLRISECRLRCGLLAYHETKMAADPFPNLTVLDIRCCRKMSQMISSSSSDVLQDMCIFQNLCHLTVVFCPRLTHLFWSKQAKHMQQLTHLKISDCDSLTAVVISNENQEEGASTSTSTSTTACMVVDHHGSHSFFPQLTLLVLCGLPTMVAFHQPTALPMEWPCLQDHLIHECPKLETPLLGPQTSQISRVLLENPENVFFEEDSVKDSVEDYEEDSEEDSVEDSEEDSVEDSVEDFEEKGWLSL